MEINPSEDNNLGDSSSETRINWDTEPLGVDMSHTCGGRNKHKELRGEKFYWEKAIESGDGWNIPTYKDILDTLG